VASFLGIKNVPFVRSKELVAKSRNGDAAREQKRGTRINN